MASADHDLHTLAGAYVLDAITEEERSVFAGHLAGCAACRDEIRELREAAARLGSSEHVWPRPELRGETIRAASQTSQLAPAPFGPDGSTTPDRSTGRQAGGGARPRWTRSRPPRRLAAARRAAAPRLALAAAAVVLAAAVGVGLVMHDTMRTLHHSQQQNQLITAVLGAPDAVMRTAHVGAGGMARVVMSDREHMGVFTAHNLPALPAAAHYQLWLMGPLGNRPAGRLTVGHSGMAGPAVIHGLAVGDMIALTVEPAGASSHPTSAPVVLIGP